MTIAHRVRVAVDHKGQVQLQLPPEFEGTEAEVIVLAERRAKDQTTPPPDDFEAFLRRTAERFKDVPAIPLEAMDRGELYDRETP